MLDTLQLLIASFAGTQAEPVCLMLQPSQVACICSNSACKFAAVSAHFVSACPTGSRSSVLTTMVVQTMALVIGMTTHFKDKSELEQHLRGINPKYNRYTEDLWNNEVTSTSQLANASLATLLACGVKSPVHAEDIIAQSKAAGKCSSIAGDRVLCCNLLLWFNSMMQERNNSPS